MSATTFRVSEIPIRVSKEQLFDLVKSILSSDSGGQTHDIVIVDASLALSPTDPKRFQVATITFGSIPDKLRPCGGTGGQVRFDIKVGSVSSQISFDAHFIGFTPLNDGAADGEYSVDLIFVTGLAGHAFGSWRARGEKTMWIRDFLAEDLDHHASEKCRILTYGYDSTLIANNSGAGVREFSSSFLEAIKNSRSLRAENDRPIIFVAHSLGGIVVKQALVDAATGSGKDRHIFRATYACIFLGVPNRGLSTDQLTIMVKGQRNDSLMSDLGEGTPFLHTLHNSFCEGFNLEHSRIIAIFETKLSRTVEQSETSQWPRTGPEIEMVTKDSAIFSTQTEARYAQLSRDVDHSNLAKFDRRADQDYINLRGKIIECIEEAPSVIEGRFTAVLQKVIGKHSLDAPADELELQALEARKKVLGNDHPDTLIAMAYLALTYRKQGRSTEAEGLQLQVLEASKRVLGIDHPDTLGAMANLASTYSDQGRWTEAEELQLQTLEALKRVLGNDHPDTLTAMANLGSTYCGQGLWTEGEELVLQALEAHKRVLGNDHPDTLTAMANLASTYWSQGRSTESEELGLQALEARKRVLGNDHPDTLMSMASLGSMYCNQGLWTEAEELELQVLEAKKRLLGNDHPDTLSAMSDLAATYSAHGRWTEAEELEIQVLEASQRVLGNDHPDTLKSMGRLTMTYLRQGRWTEAEELGLLALETRKRVLGNDHLDTLKSMGSLASAYSGQGRSTEAEGLQLQVLEALKRVLGNDHPDTLTTMANLGSTYWKQGRWTEVEELELQVLEANNRVQGNDHPDTLTAMANLALTYSSQERWTEAEELQLQVLEARKRVLGKDHPDTQSAIGSLASTYRSQGRSAEAIPLQKEKDKRSR